MMKIKWILFIGLIISGCSDSTTGSLDEDNGQEPPDGMAGFPEIVINTEVINKEAADTYLVYLVDPDRYGGLGEATLPRAYAGPFETNSSGTVIIDLEFNSQVSHFLDELAEKRIKVVVATVEDFNLFNSLNEETYIEFVENPDEDTIFQYRYLSKTRELDLELVDAYPEGVISIAWPEAYFVIKLEFAEDVSPHSAYQVRLRNPDTGMGPAAPLTRRSRYYNTPYYEDSRDHFRNSSFEVQVIYQPDRISYEEEPLFLQFDGDGNCLQGENNVVTITINE